MPSLGSRRTGVHTAAIAALLYLSAGAGAGALGCARSAIPNLETSLVPSIPGEGARCQLAANQDNPLVTEWPASEKANLEARLSEGAVVVAYSGCSLRMLPACRAAGHYGWRRTTAATDVIEIHDADELYAKLPLGAVSLEGELQQRGRLAVQTTVSGQMQLSGFEASALAKDESCQGATHVLSALSVGAFKLRAGGARSGQGKVDVQTIGTASGTSSHDESVLREAGVPERCVASSSDAPDQACASPIQLFLRPLPSNIVDRGPLGTVKVRFWPVEPAQDWKVVVGDREVCTTPCERWVDPAMPFSLKYDPGFWHRNERVELPDLRKYAQLERMDVRVIPRTTGEFVVGILATSLGGAATATGIVLTAVGCGKGGALCTAGLINLPIGAAVTAGGVWMIVDSAGQVNVTPSGQRGVDSSFPSRP
jgi:hypothetical protein